MMPIDKKQRRCLGCQKFFKSQHKGHRICPVCSPKNLNKGAVRKPQCEDT